MVYNAVSDPSQMDIDEEPSGEMSFTERHDSTVRLPLTMVETDDAVPFRPPPPTTPYVIPQLPQANSPHE